jgi:hypothetical protein
MNDPHIDIDDLDNEKPSAEPKKSAKLETDFDFTDQIPPSSSGNFTGMFGAMTQQFRQWGEQMRSDYKIVPDESMQHLRNSQKEFLLAWRSFIDHSLERIERQEARDQIRRESGLSNSGTKIIVEDLDE